MDLDAILDMVRASGSFHANDDTINTRFVNQACYDFREATRNKVSSFTLLLTNGQSVYDLTDIEPNGVIAIKSASTVQSNSQAEVDVISFNELDDSDYLTGVNTGIPTKMVLLGSQSFKLLPTPNSDDISLSGWVVPKPAALTLGTDVPDEDSEYHMAIFYRTMQLALQYDRQSEVDAQNFQRLFLEEVDKARSVRSKIGGYKNTRLKPPDGYIPRNRLQGIYNRRIVGY